MLNSLINIHVKCLNNSSIVRISNMGVFIMRQCIRIICPAGQVLSLKPSIFK